jgi:hypothetical protein
MAERVDLSRSSVLIHRAAIIYLTDDLILVFPETGFSASHSD